MTDLSPTREPREPSRAAKDFAREWTDKCGGIAHRRAVCESCFELALDDFAAKAVKEFRAGSSEPEKEPHAKECICRECF